MARAKWCGPEIYDAAAAFKERCLIGDDSLFTPGNDVWTPDSVEALSSRVAVEDLSPGTFIGKLQAQFDGLEPSAVQVGAELLYVVLLSEHDTGGAKKREHLARLLEALPAPITLPPPLDSALDAGGVAGLGQAKTRRDAGVRFLAALSARLKGLARDDRSKLLASPWDFRTLVEDVRTPRSSTYANAFLHLLYPEQFEYMVSETHRTKLIAAFELAPGVAEAANVDRKIARIRELASAGGDPAFDFYEDPFYGIWKDEAPGRWDEAVHWAQRLFTWDAFDANERDYKLAVAERVAVARQQLLAGASDWLQRLESAFGDSQNNLTNWRAHDAFLTWCAANDTVATELLRAFWESEDVLNGVHTFLTQLPREAASGVGTRTSFASFLLLGVDATRWPFYKPTVHNGFRKVLGLPRTTTLEIDPEAMYRPEELAARLGLDGRRVRDFLRATYPREAAEREASWFLAPDQAQRVLDEFGDQIDPSAGDAAYADWLALLEELRLRMLGAGTLLRDLLDAQGLAWWLGRLDAPEDWDEADRAAYDAFRRGAAPEPTRKIIDDTGLKPQPGDVALPAVTAELAAKLYLPVSWLDRLLGLLAEKKQVILYGPPGTGKTYIAQHMGRHLAERGGSYRLVQFHPSYTYEDFFEGYRPQQQDGKALTFELVPGVLRELAHEATNHPDVPHLLIIDEINRGNIAKIFGELYFLLEYRDEAIRLQYSRQGEFTLPRNLFVIGTMNTADRSIALVDSALRRRFYFVGLLPTRPPVDRLLANWLEAHALAPDAADLLEELNRAIDDEDFSIGPSYFINRQGTEPDLERIWTHAVMPLLEEHFYRTGREVEKEFGLAAMRTRVANAADASDADEDA